MCLFLKIEPLPLQRSLHSPAVVGCTLPISDNKVAYIYTISTSLAFSGRKQVKRIRKKIPMGNKCHVVSVICTYIGSNIEKRIFRVRHPERAFHLFHLYAHLGSGASAV